MPGRMAGSKNAFCSAPSKKEGLQDGRGPTAVWKGTRRTFARSDRGSGENEEYLPGQTPAAGICGPVAGCQAVGQTPTAGLGNPSAAAGLGGPDICGRAWPEAGSRAWWARGRQPGLVGQSPAAGVGGPEPGSRVWWGSSPKLCASPLAAWWGSSPKLCASPLAVFTPSAFLPATAAAHLMVRVAAASSGMSSRTRWNADAANVPAVRHVPTHGSSGTTRSPTERPSTCAGACVDVCVRHTCCMLPAICCMLVAVEEALYLR
eukprot:351973-Chlamydomonas_euryale.AAC.5